MTRLPQSKTLTWEDLIADRSLIRGIVEVVEGVVAVHRYHISTIFDGHIDTDDGCEGTHTTRHCSGYGRNKRWGESAQIIQQENGRINIGEAMPSGYITLYPRGVQLLPLEQVDPK